MLRLVSLSLRIGGASVSGWALCVREAAALYRPRRPEGTSFYRLLERHFEDYARVHSERFAPRHGPLRRVVRKNVEQFLDCGRHASGFARLRCAGCGSEHLVAFSCQTRNFCPSCQAKRAALFAEHFVEVIRLPVPHRHMVFTIPKALRGLFERDRRLLSILSRAAYDALRTALQGALGRRDALPGTVASPFDSLCSLRARSRRSAPTATGTRTSTRSPPTA